MRAFVLILLLFFLSLLSYSYMLRLTRGAQADPPPLCPRRRDEAIVPPPFHPRLKLRRRLQPRDVPGLRQLRRPQLVGSLYGDLPE